MSESPFGLQPHLDFLYGESRRRTVSGGREEARGEFRRCLGLEGRLSQPVSAELIRTADRPNHVEEKLSLSAGEGVSIPLYVLVPKTKPPYKPVLAFPGHEPGIRDCIGDFSDPETARIRRSENDNYAEFLAGCGYLVAAVEQRGLGERQAPRDAGRESRRSCRELALAYMMTGRTLLGERCWDGMRAADYLLSRPDAAPGGLGCTGHSGGGTTALALAVLDERIRATLVSGYFCSFRDSILSIDHCECNYIPGILNVAEMGGLAALIAPRPFCAVNGEQDPIFPLAGAVREFETVRREYARRGAEEACRLEIHPGGHRYQNEISRRWFERWL